jgi:hypothetical protein
MLRVEATIRSDKHIPFSITGTDASLVSPKARPTMPDQFAMWLQCERNLSG